MPLYRASLQSLGAIALLAVALACGGKKAEPAAVSTTIQVSGTVTYARVPLAKDTNGVPTGLADSSVAANVLTKPARGAMVRIYQRTEQANPDGSTTSVWLLLKSVFTDATGAYTLTVPKDKPLMVELISTFYGGDGQQVNLSGDPAGINSTAPLANRYRYAMRKAIDGTAPAGNPAPAAVPTGDSVVNFSIGLADAWWLVDPAYNLGSMVATTAVTTPIAETTLPGRTLGTGSRILAIGDTIATCVSSYGSATPGISLDLYYAPGVSEPRGSFVEYDRTVYPLAFDSQFGILRYFGSLRGGPVNDDAWDEGVILPLLTRNVLFAGNNNRTFSIPFAPLFPQAAALTDLSPDMARIEGLADAMAANLLKSPYLADTQGTSLASPVLDIRDISAFPANQLSVYSAPAIRALAWEVILKANSITSPGTPTDWSNLNSAIATRFFIAPSPTLSASNRDVEPLNIYSQLSRLQETKQSTETVDLAAVFTNTVLTSLVQPFGLTWPRPTTGTQASFVIDWASDPNPITTPLPPLTLSMAKAVQVQGLFPNQSQDEVFYAGFSLSADKRYVVNATISPALAAGSAVDLDLPLLNRTFTFTGTGGSFPGTVLTVNSTAPVYHPVRVRLRSPAAVQPDVVVTVAFIPSL